MKIYAVYNKDKEIKLFTTYNKALMEIQHLCGGTIKTAIALMPKDTKHPWKCVLPWDFKEVWYYRQYYTNTTEWLKVLLKGKTCLMKFSGQNGAYITTTYTIKVKEVF